MTVAIPLLAVVALLIVWCWRCPPVPPTTAEVMALMAEELRVLAGVIGESMAPAAQEAAEAMRGLADTYRQAVDG